MYNFYSPRKLVWLLLILVAGCDQNNITPIQESHGTAQQKLHTKLSSALTLKPLSGTQFISKTETFQFPFIVSKEVSNAADPAFGVAFISDGSVSNPHLELTDPLENMQVGEKLNSYEADGPTRQMSRISVSRATNGFTTQARFYPNPFLPEANNATQVLVAFYDEEALTNDAQYFKLFNRSQLETGILNLQTSTLGTCLGNADQIALCESISINTRALKKSGTSAHAISEAKICLPASIGSGGINYVCWGNDSALSKSSTTADADAHLRLDFHLVLDPQNPLAFTAPERMIAAYVMEGDTAFGLAGYRRAPSEFSVPFMVELERFKQVSGLPINE